MEIFIVPTPLRRFSRRVVLVLFLPVALQFLAFSSAQAGVDVSESWTAPHPAASPAKVIPLSTTFGSVPIGPTTLRPDWGYLYSRAPVVILGDLHTNLSVFDHLMQELPDLKAAGLTHIGLEGLSKKKQADVDRYMAGEASSFPHLPGGMSEYRTQYQALFDKAREMGVRISAIDMPFDVRERATVRIENHVINPAVAFHVARLYGRNLYMAKRIGRVLRREPNSKVLSLVGLGHVSHPKGEEFISADTGVTIPASCMTIGACLKHRFNIASWAVAIRGGLHVRDLLLDNLAKSFPAIYGREANFSRGFTTLPDHAAVWDLGPLKSYDDLLNWRWDLIQRYKRQ